MSVQRQVRETHFQRAVRQRSNIRRGIPRTRKPARGLPAVPYRESRRRKRGRIEPLLNQTNFQSLENLKRKQSLKEFKAGTHPQMWRVHRHGGMGARLGAMGALGDDIIIEISLDSGLERELMPVMGLTRIELAERLNVDVITPTIMYLLGYIRSYVPKRSGKLRESLERAMTASGGSNTLTFPMELILNTSGVEYAKVVNKMPDDWLKHPGANHPNTWRGQALEDPEARTGWYNFLLINGRNRAESLFNKFITRMFTRQGPSLVGILRGVGRADITRQIKKLIKARFK